MAKFVLVERRIIQTADSNWIVDKPPARHCWQPALWKYIFYDNKLFDAI